MRSIGLNAQQETSQVSAVFPELAADLVIPPLYPSDSHLSNELRVCSGRTITPPPPLILPHVPTF